jgi:hypothetical protein
MPAIPPVRDTVTGGSAAEVGVADGLAGPAVSLDPEPDGDAHPARTTRLVIARFRRRMSL